MMASARQTLKIAAVLACTALAAGYSKTSVAVENGSGVYALGYIAPQAGLLPPAGSYASYNYYAYRGGSTTAVSATRQVAIPGTHLKLREQLSGSLRSEVDSASSLISLTQVFAAKIVGGQAGLALLLPYARADLALQGSGTLSLSGPSGRVHRLALDGAEQARDSGPGDTTVSGLLGWHDGRLHSLAMLNVYVPTGSYDQRRAVNVGRNHWAIEPMAALTYLNEANGLELSAAAGITFNQTNHATTTNRATNFTPTLRRSSIFRPTSTSGWPPTPTSS